MKTQNNTTGNKNNSLEKVMLRSAAVIISFVLISFTVSAQGFWRQLLTNNSFSKVAMVMVEESNANAEVSPAPANVESEFFYVEPAIDKPLDLEGWMTDDAYFGAFNNIFKPETEKSLEIEDWMKDENHFAIKYAVQKDQDLPIEAWMTDNAHWRL